MKKETLFTILCYLLTLPTFIIPLFVFSTLPSSLSTEQLLHQDVLSDLKFNRDPVIEPNLYHSILKFIPSQRLLGILLFATILFLTFALLKEKKPLFRILCTFLLFLTPITVGAALYDAQVLLFIALLLAALYFFKKQKTIPTLLVFAAYSTASIAHTLLGILVLTTYAVFTKGWKDSKKTLLLTGSTGLLTALLSKAPLFYSYYAEQLSLSSLFVELGAKRGVGVFFITLAAFAIWRLWSKHRSSQVVFALTILSFALTPYLGDFAIALATFLLLPYAAWSLHHLLTQKWESPFFYYVGICALICGLLFTQLAYLDRAYTYLPDQAALDALSFAKEKTPPNAVIFSHPQNGYLIESIADRKAYTTTYVTSSSDPRFKLKVSDLLFNERNFEEGVALIKSAGITHILITPHMKNGQIWYRDGEGLLFILRDKNTFKKIYSKGGYDLYEIQ
ncbi:hypothetical protein D6774_00545 [Candidatus Woesearchaeota archaeon]|nr:MAG: hypothetical protein D6774_00545 [Candidatus Woesearchaeota archaeon]